MKQFISIMFILWLTISCGPKAKTDDNGIVIGDTITTESGLKYVYNKIGNGPKIEHGTEVFAYNKLLINGKVIWSTDNSKDSVFSFVQNGTGLIKGALELYPLLRQGDNVTAIMHGDIGYGPQGRDIIPPNATLVFDPIIIKKVGPKKAFFNDSLLAKIQNGGVDKAIAFYDAVMTTNLKNEYHTNPYSLQGMFRELMTQNLNSEMEVLCAHIEKTAEGEAKGMFRWYKSVAAENQGKIQLAIDYLQPFLDEKPVRQNVLQKLQALKSKLKK